MPPILNAPPAWAEIVELEEEHPAGMGGTMAQFLYPNGYGCSVVRFPGSYGYHMGLYELAVLKASDAGRATICYSTPITGDVIGHLSPEEVEGLAKQTFEIPPDRIAP